MKRIILPFLLTFIIAGELEVDGNLKVSGNIDAQNQAIKNVGVPQELTDAINGNVLQDALRDDGDYEYTILFVNISTDSGGNGTYQINWHSGWKNLEDMNVYEPVLNELSTLPEQVSSLFNNGWQLESINGDAKSWWIFKRAIDE